MCRQGNKYRAIVLVNVHANRTLTVPPFQAVSGSYRMRPLHASPSSSQETGHGEHPLHLHPHHSRRASVHVLRPGHQHRRRRRHGPRLPRHAVAALDGITGARVDWADSRGLNEHERQALELSEERSQLAAGHR
jgi:hypothetical protein